MQASHDHAAVAHVKGTATFSACGTWRYRLTREWGDRGGPLVVIGANPSTATAEIDDPTIRLEVKLAERWKHSYYVKVNAYAFRSPDPKVMWAARRCGVDIVGPENDAEITKAMTEAKELGGTVIAAWGSIVEPGRAAMLGAAAGLLGVSLYVFGLNRSGTPWHPLYKKLPSDPILWRVPA